jgi:hypothetical protein
MSQQPSLSLHELRDWLQVRTVGDLWKALQEGKTPAVAVSAISLGPPYGPNILQPKFPKPADQLKWDVLNRALVLCGAEGGDRAEAMRKLIARVALARGVDWREIVNMPLARFVEATAKQQDGPFSTDDSPSRWAKQFKMSARTFKRRVKDGKIRAKILSDRSYQVHLDDLPKQEKANESSHK